MALAATIAFVIVAPGAAGAQLPRFDELPLGRAGASLRECGRAEALSAATALEREDYLGVLGAFAACRMGNCLTLAYLIEAYRAAGQIDDAVRLMKLFRSRCLQGRRWGVETRRRDPTDVRASTRVQAGNEDPTRCTGGRPPSVLGLSLPHERGTPSFRTVGYRNR